MVEACHWTEIATARPVEMPLPEASIWLGQTPPGCTTKDDNLDPTLRAPTLTGSGFLDKNGERGWDGDGDGDGDKKNLCNRGQGYIYPYPAPPLNLIY